MNERQLTCQQEENEVPMEQYTSLDKPTFAQATRERLYTIPRTFSNNGWNST